MRDTYPNEKKEGVGFWHKREKGWNWYSKEKKEGGGV